MARTDAEYEALVRSVDHVRIEGTNVYVPTIAGLVLLMKRCEVRERSECIEIAEGEIVDGTKEVARGRRDHDMEIIAGGHGQVHAATEIAARIRARGNP